MEESQEFFNPSDADTYFIVELNKYYKNILNAVDDTNSNKPYNYDAQKKVSNENYSGVHLRNKERHLFENEGNKGSEIRNRNEYVVHKYGLKKDRKLNKEKFNDDNTIGDWKPKLEAEKNPERITSDDIDYDVEGFTEDMVYDTKDNEHKVVDINYNDDADLTRLENEVDLNRIKKRILRDNSSEMKKQSTLLRKAKKRHLERVRKVYEFMQDHPDSTQYFYDEMERIIIQRAVKDDLRKMVTYLEKRENEDIKGKVIHCYIEARQEKLRHPTLYSHPTNNLVIHYIKHPDSDNI